MNVSGIENAEISPFGFTLGSKLDPKYFKEDIKMYPSGKCIDTFDPITPNENFKLYRVCISPISHTIFRVSAYEDLIKNVVENRNDKILCKPFFDDFANIVKEKYNFLSLELKDETWISLKNEFLSIQINCYDKTYYDFFIIYELISEELKSLRNQEATLFIENRKNEIDKSGL